MENTNNGFWQILLTNNEVVPGRAECAVVPAAGQGELEELVLFWEGPQEGTDDCSGERSS